MEDIRREIRKNRLERLIQDIETKLEYIADARGRMESRRGLRRAQRDFITTQVDELLKVRNDIVNTLPETARLQFEERTLSYLDLRENITAGHPIRMRLLLLFAELLTDVEEDLQHQKHKVENEIKDLEAKWSRRSRFMVTMSFCLIVRYILRKFFGG